MMFTNVLVGVDGRQGGHDAIALARQLAPPDAVLTLAHIYAYTLGRGGAMAMPFEHSQARELLERERDMASLEAALAVAAAGSVGRGLHELAEEQRTDLLVIGSCRRALLRRALVGDDARAALNGAPCAIAIAPWGFAHTRHALKDIGVGYDGSPESEHALAAARELASRHSGGVTACRVVSMRDFSDQQGLEGWPMAVEREVERCSQRLAQLEGVGGVATYGDAKDELVSFSRGRDLLIVGSRGYGPVGRLLHGSVSNHLLGRAGCPLLVVPRRALGDENKPELAQTALQGGE